MGAITIILDEKRRDLYPFSILFWLRKGYMAYPNDFGVPGPTCHVIFISNDSALCSDASHSCPFAK